MTSENSYEPLQPSISNLNDNGIFVLHLLLPMMGAESSALVIWSGPRCSDGDDEKRSALLLTARRDCELMKMYGSSILSNALILCIRERDENLLGGGISQAGEFLFCTFILTKIKFLTSRSLFIHTYAL